MHLYRFYFGNSSGSVINIKFLEKMLHVILYSEGTDGQNDADLGIGLAHLYPLLISASRPVNPWASLSTVSAKGRIGCGRGATPRKAVSR
jgi:hypothetical protein